MKGFVVLFALFSLNLFAANIAIIDSGVDYKHTDLLQNLWINPNEVLDRRDNDGNGYQDDIHGWNFAESKPEVIDYKFLGTFSPDVKTFFTIQGKIMMNQASSDDIAWYKEKAKDQKFMSELSKFGNFVHGTHVAGIAAKESNAMILAAKLIPTEVKPFVEARIKNMDKENNREKIMAALFKALAVQQMNLLEEIGFYINEKQASIANGSFGTGFKQAKMITDIVFRIVHFRKPTEEESDKTARMFLSAVLEQGSRMLNAAPKTLFVFAAGNDGTNNDIYPTSPTNIKAENTISVAATYEREFLAPFSNYGVEMVDVAAPGMLIDSAIPGNDHLKVSGTSQAAPYVANIAGQIKDANPALKPSEIKELLMRTVDKKGFLVGKVKSGGVVNPERAVLAAQLSKTLSLNEAVERASLSVQDYASRGIKLENVQLVTPIPMYPLYQ